MAAQDLLVVPMYACYEDLLSIWRADFAEIWRSRASVVDYALDQEEDARDLEDALDDGSVSEGSSHGSCIVAHMLPAQRLV
jgi:hypothetical protein